VTSSQSILRLLERLLAPAVFAAFAVLFWIDADVYYQALREDRGAEWVTAVFLFAAGVLFLLAGLRQRRAGDRRAWFLLLLGVVMVLGGLEEISWGQRLVGVDSPEFFLEHSDQQEINVHNVVQSVSGVKTKHVTALVLFGYGVLLPLLCRWPGPADLCRRLGIMVPPRSLIPSWILATVAMIDRPTGEEEELGELLYSICLLLVASGVFLVTRIRAAAP